MFNAAKSKLEDTRTIFEQLRNASDPPTFKALFNSFLGSARAITAALQKEGSKKPGFNEWYGEKQKEMKNDELLRFIHEARTEDFHEGKHRLVFATYMEHFSTAAVGKPPAPNAKIGIGADGPFWIIHEGTPKERRIPIKQGGNFSIRISIANPPTTHLGGVLKKNDPLSICQVALDYYGNLVYEAGIKFK